MNIRSLAKNLGSAEDSIDGDYYILISVNPFNKVPFGEIDPEEIPPRHPYSMPNYNIEMVDVATLNNNLAGGNYIVLGKVNFRANFADRQQLYSTINFPSESSEVGRLLSELCKISIQSPAVCI